MSDSDDVTWQNDLSEMLFLARFTASGDTDALVGVVQLARSFDSANPAIRRIVMASFAPILKIAAEFDGSPLPKNWRENSSLPPSLRRKLEGWAFVYDEAIRLACMDLQEQLTELSK